MKHYWKKIVTVVLVVSAIVGSGYYGHQQGYEEGREKGYDDGYSYGYSLAYTAGVEMANAKYHQGYDDGYSDAGGIPKPNFTGEKLYLTDLDTGEVIAGTVYVTDYGTKYHKSGCQYLRQSCNSISLSDAKDQGYSACSRCW